MLLTDRRPERLLEIALDISRYRNRAQQFCRHGRQTISMRGHIACILARAGLNIIVVARIGFVAGQIATNLLIYEARRSLVERTSERIRVWLGGSCFLHVLWTCEACCPGCSWCAPCC